MPKPHEFRSTKVVKSLTAIRYVMVIVLFQVVDDVTNREKSVTGTKRSHPSNLGMSGRTTLVG